MSNPLYLTLVSPTGTTRHNAVCDMPTTQPRRADFDQYAVLAGKRHEVHFYARGMNYTEAEIAAFVMQIINNPLVRAAAIGRPVPLPGDTRMELLLIVDEYDKPGATIVEARLINDTDEIEIDQRPIRAERDTYSLPFIFKVYEAAGFVFHQIPRAPEDTSVPTSAGYVGIHPRTGLMWDTVAAVFIAWLEGRQP